MADNSKPVSEEEKKGTEELNIVSGIYSDIEALLNKFEEANSVRFTAFAEIWVQSNFSFIFWGLRKFYEKLEVTEDMLRIALLYARPSKCFEQRIGAVYLLYALYVKQLVQPKVRIRITMTQWQSLEDLLCLALQQEHHDFVYIVRWLQFSNAFDFVAFEKQYAYPWSMQLQRGYGIQDDDDDADDMSNQALKNYVDEGHLLMLSTIHEKYSEIKKELIENKTIDAKSMKSLSLSLPNIGKNLNLRIKKYLSRSDKSGGDEDEAEECDKEESVAEKRKRIKESQYSSAISSVHFRQSKFTN